MIEKYYKFALDDFFNDYAANLEELECLKISLKDLDGSPKGKALEHVPLCHSFKSDVVLNTVAKKETLERKIKGLEGYFKLRDKLLNKLSDEEREVLLNHYLQGDLETPYSQSEYYRRLTVAKKKISMHARWVV